MVADKCKGDHSNGLNDTTVDEQAAFELPARFGWHHGSLCDNCDYDYHHTDERQCASFRELELVSHVQSSVRGFHLP